MTARTPRSTYRLQLTAEFDLFEAAKRLPYLHDLGVDWVYLSPLLAAEAGSEHGYDVAVHTREDPERGGSTGLDVLATAARTLGMGVLVDIVPNHVGVASPRPATWWWDVLEHGRASRFASYFDIDWDAGAGRLLVPVVGDDDEGAIEVDADAREVRYHELRLPMAPSTTTLDEQHYELASWRRGDAELNYRRFFTVTTLAGIRVEEPEVFDASHAEIKRWFDVGLVDGLRVDHPDGLRDPGEYLDRLAALTGSAYVLVEKILEPGEELPSSWACAGTTGYDVLGVIDRVLTEPAGEPLLDQLSGSVDFAELTHDTKRRSPTPRSRPRCAGSSASCPRSPVRGRCSATPWPSCSRASRSTAPTCPSVSSTWRSRSPAPAPGVPTCWPRSTHWSRSCPTRPSRPRCGSSRPRGW